MSSTIVDTPKPPPEVITVSRDPRTPRTGHGLRGQLVPRHFPPFMARRAKRPWLPRMAPHTRRSIRARFT